MLSTSQPTSAAGAVWAKERAQYNKYPRGVAYGNGLWLVVDSIDIATFYDGNNVMVDRDWGGGGPDAVWFDALYLEDQDTWVLAGMSYLGTGALSIKTGTDYFEALRTVGSGSDLQAIAASGTKVVATGASGSIVIADISDLSTWTEVRTGPAVVGGVTYGNGTFVAVGDEGTLLHSVDDGVTWQTATSVPPALGTTDLMSVTYGAGQFVAVGEEGTILTSVDGLHWSLSVYQSPNRYVDVAYGEGVFVAVASNGPIISSSDAINWAPDVASDTEDLFRVAFGDGKFMATDRYSIYTRSAYQPSDNADLTDLTVSPGTLDMDFDAQITSYTKTVMYDVDSLTVTPTVADAKATVTVNTDTIASGDSATVSLNVGANTINVVVTAENGTKKTYKIVVTRLLPAPAWAGDTRNFVDDAVLKATVADAPGNWHAVFSLFADSGYSEHVDDITGSPVAPGDTSTASWPISVPRGTYYVAIKAVQADISSPWAEEGSLRFNRAPQAPTNLDPFLNAWVNTGTPTLSWIFTDPDGTMDAQGAFQVQIVRLDDSLVLDTGEVGGKGSGHQEFYTLAADQSLPDSVQSYKWRVRTWDIDGAEGPYTAEAFFRVDATPPTGTVSLGGSTFTTSRTVALTLTATDATSGVARMRFSTDDETWSAWEAYDTSKTYMLPEGDGDKTVYVQFVDAAGNVSDSASDSIFLDMEPPSGSILINDGAAATNKSAVMLTLSATDAGLGVSEMRFGSNGHVWTEWEQYDETKSYTLESGDGNRTVYVQFRDEAGHESAPVWATIMVDTVPPTAGAGNLHGYQNSRTFDLPWSGGDAGSGLDSVHLYSSEDGGNTWELYGGPYTASPISVTVTKDGQYSFSFVAVDKAGNWEATPAGPGSVERSTLVDTVAPSAEAKPLSQYQTNKEFDVEWEGTDVGSGVDYVRLYFSTDGGTTWTGFGNVFEESPISFTASTDGIYYFSVVAVDKAGNAEDAPDRPGNIEASTVVDTVAPRITVSGLDTYQLDRTFDLSWTGDDGSGTGLAYVELYYSRNGGNWTKYGTTFTTSPITFVADDDGAYDFIAVGVDVAGNAEDLPVPSAKPEASTLVDTQRPSAKVSVQLDEYQTRDAFDIEWDGDDGDGSGLKHVKLYYSINNGTTWNQYGTTFLTSPIEFTAATDGMYAFSIVAVDNAGNEEAAPVGAGAIEAGTTVDREAPQNLTMQINDGAAIITSQAVTLRLSAVDAVSGVGDMRFSINGGASWGGWAPYQTASTYQLPAGDGIKTVSVQVRDRAGNVSGSASATIILDETAPTTTVEALASYQTSWTFDLDWEGRDGDGSGVDHVVLYYSVDGGANWARYGATYTASPIPFTAERDGQYLFGAVAVDRAGHTGAGPSTQAWTMVDTVAPDATVYASQYHTDPDSPIALTWVNNDHGGSGVNHGKLFYSTDGGATWAQDVTPVTSSPFSFAAPADGTYSFAIIAVDEAGNAKPDPAGPSAVQAQTIVDTIPPTATVLPLDPYQTSEWFGIPWTGTDEGSGLSVVRLSYSTDGGATWTENSGVTSSPINFQASGDGPYMFRVRAVDKAGNEQTAFTGTASTIVDRTAPTVKFGDVAEYQTSRTFDLDWEGDDGVGSGIDYVTLYYSTNEGATWQPVADTSTAPPASFTAPADGEYTFALVATDKAGHSSQAPVGAGSIGARTTVDTVAPQNLSLQINAGALYTKSDAVTLTLAATDALSGVSQMRFSADGTTWGDWKPFAPEYVYTLPGPDGSKTVYAQFTDQAGNESAVVDASILLDTQLPTATLDPLSEYQLSWTFDVSGAADDGSGAGLDYMRLYFSRDNGNTWMEYGDGFTEFPISFTAGSDGRHAFSLVAVDKAGNEMPMPDGAGSIQASTMVDSQPPDTWFGLLDEYWDSHQFNLPWDGDDLPGSGLAYVKLYYSVDDEEEWTEYPGTFTTSPISFTADRDGIYSFRLIGTDEAGHEEEPTVKGQIVVDTMPPEDLSIRINNGASSTTRTRVTLTLSATDATSGLDEMRFSTDEGEDWSSWERYATTRSFVLPSGLGKKTVSVQFRDVVGNESAVVSAEITLRPEPPAPPEPEVAPGEGAPPEPEEPPVHQEVTEVRVDLAVDGAPLTVANREALGELSGSGQPVAGVAIGVGEIEAALAAAEEELADGAVATPARVVVSVGGTEPGQAMVLDPSGVQAVVAAGADLVVRTPRATLVIPAATVAQVAGADPSGRLVVLMEDVGEQRDDVAAQVGEGFQRAVSPVVEITLATLYPNGTLERHHQMQVPVTLTLPYDPSQVADGSLVGIYLLLEDEDGNVIGRRYVGGTADSASGTVTVDRPTLSKYVVLAARRYVDVATEHWAHDDIYDLTLRGIVTGVTATTYEPDRQVTRAEFATMLARAMNLPADPATLAAFPDVEAGAWYEETVSAAVKAGLLKGYTDGTLRPQGEISREEMATVLARVLEQRYGRKPLMDAEADLLLAAFADEGQATWSRGALAQVVQSGLMQGRSATELAPQGIVTRAEATAMLRRMLDLTQGANN